MTWIRDDVTVRMLLEQRAAADPRGVCLSFAGEAIDFATLDAAVNRLANALAERGIGAGARVAVMMDNHPDHVFAFLALAKLGAVQIPVNTRLRHDPLAYVLSHGDPALLLADARFHDDVAEALGGGGTSAPCLCRGVPGRGGGGGPGDGAPGRPAAGRRAHGAVHLRHHGPSQGSAGDRSHAPGFGRCQRPGRRRR